MVGRTIVGATTSCLSFQFPPLPEHSIIFYPFDKPTVEDVFTKQIRTLYACTVSGPQTQRTILTLGHNHLMIKIGLQPGILYRVLGTSLTEMLFYKDYDGEAIFGNEVKHVIDAFANAKNFETMKTVADNFMIGMLSKIKKPLAIDHVIPEILKTGGMIKIDALVKSAYMGNRQFERVFKDRMGVSAKFYSRLVRFTKAWLLKETKPHLTWTQVAYECNYFDQMHLTRDFREFANINPKYISDALEKQPFLAVKGIFY